MKSLGIDLKKEEIRWCLVSGTLQTPIYESHGRKKYSIPSDRAELMKTFHNLFTELLAEVSPEIVTYRVTQAAKSIDQMAYLLMPLGILGKLCHDGNISVRELNSSSYTYKKFNLPKGSKPLDHWIASLGPTVPHWDQSQQNATLSAWAGTDG
jgi:hypothetical protein